MAPETARPRWWLLALLGLAVAGYVANTFWPSASAGTAPPASNGGRPAARRSAPVQPADLQVKMAALESTPTSLAEGARNPFRFQPVAPPAPPPMATTAPPDGPVLPAVPPPPSGPPPIPLKFIGILERGDLKIAALSDCRNTFQAVEGQTVDGRYRLVRIGIESIVMEYLDGSGRTTIRAEGCSSR